MELAQTSRQLADHTVFLGEDEQAIPTVDLSKLASF